MDKEPEEDKTVEGGLRDCAYKDCKTTIPLYTDEGIVYCPGHLAMKNAKFLKI